MVRPRCQVDHWSWWKGCPLLRGEIGGGVTLIGNPTKAAEPVTRHLLDCYDTWLFYERRFLRFERYGSNDPDRGHDPRFAFVDLNIGTALTS